MHWQINTVYRTDIEKGEHLANLNGEDVSTHEILFDDYLMKDGGNKKTLSWSGTRRHSRILITDSFIYLFTYELKGFFGVYKIPFEEMTELSYDNGSPSQIQIRGKGNVVAKLLTNKEPEYFIKKIIEIRDLAGADEPLIVISPEVTSSHDTNGNLTTQTKPSIPTKTFHARLLLQYVPNLLKYVKIEDGKIKYFINRNKNFDLELSSVQVTYKPRGYSQILGYGDITINDGGRSYEVPNLNNGRGFRRLVEKLQNLEKSDVSEELNIALHAKNKISEPEILPLQNQTHIIDENLDRMAAIKLLDLTDSFSESELFEKWQFWIKRAPDGMIPKINAAYELLLTTLD